MQEPNVVLLLFQSGKLVCTDARMQEHVHQSIQKIYSILTEIDAFKVALIEKNEQLPDLVKKPISGILYVR